MNEILAAFIVIIVLIQIGVLALMWVFIKSAVKAGVQQALWETLPKFCSENQIMPPQQNFMPPQNTMPPQQGYYNMPPR